MIERETRCHENARAPAMRETSVSFRVSELHRRDDEAVSMRGKPYPFRRIENRRGIDERGDHQAVPIRKNFVVEAGVNPHFSHLEQALPQWRKPCFFGKRRSLCFEAV